MLNLFRKLFVACLLVAGMTAVGFAQTASEPNVIGSREGHFCVRFPGDPQVSHDATIAEGVSIYVHSAVLEKNDGKLAYAITYAELPFAVLKGQIERGVTDFDRVVGCAQGFLNGSAANVEAERTINLSGVVGKEIAFSRPDGTHGKYRVYVIGGRIYQLIVGWKGTAPAENESANFLDSFAFVQ